MLETKLFGILFSWQREHAHRSYLIRQEGNEFSIRLSEIVRGKMFSIVQMIPNETILTANLDIQEVLIRGMIARLKGQIGQEQAVQLPG